MSGKGVTREGLYELVWSEPISRISKRFGVSDVAVAKVCRKLNVPRPGRGMVSTRRYPQLLYLERH